MILLTFTTLTLDTGYTNSCLFALSYCMPQEHLIGMFCLQLLVVGILIALTSRDALVAIDLCIERYLVVLTTLYSYFQADKYDSRFAMEYWRDGPKWRQHKTHVGI